MDKSSGDGKIYLQMLVTNDTSNILVWLDNWKLLSLDHLFNDKLDVIYYFQSSWHLRFAHSKYPTNTSSKLCKNLINRETLF